MRRTRAFSIILIVAAIIIVALSSAKQLRRTATRGDVEVYLHGAQLMLAGENIYSRPEPRGHQYYNYLPLLALLVTPLTLIPIGPAIVLWTALNVAVTGWILAALIRAMAQRPLVSISEGARWGLIFLTLILTLRALLYHFDLGQANLVVMAVAVLGLVGLAAGREVAGGCALGVAAVLKVIVLPLVIPFVVQARARVLAGIIAGGLTALLLPAVFLGWDRNLSYIAYWVNDIVLSTVDLRHTRFWPLNMNYSLAAQLYRFFGDVVAFEHDGRYYSVTLGRLPDGVLHAMGRVVPIAVAAIIAVYAWIHRRREALVSLWGSVALAFCLAPAFSILSHKHYFVMLLPSHVYVVYLWREAPLRDGWFRALVAGSFVVAIMSTTLFDFLGALMSNLGGLVWGSLLLAGAIFRAAAVQRAVQP